MTPSLMVRETAIIEPAAAGVHRSSSVVVPVLPIHTPEIHDTCAIVAFGLTATDGRMVGAGPVRL
jgi:hypothetical protein